jgi:hypothetical protein
MNCRCSHWSLVGRAYEDKGPRRLPVVVVQMPYEVQHDTAHNHRRHELRTSQRVEGHLGVFRRRDLRLPMS